MNEIAYSLLLVLAGWLLRGALSGRWRANPKHHRLADSRHCWVEVSGVVHAFTDDALAVAKSRADELAPLFPHRWRKRLLWLVVVGGLVLLFTGCANDGRHLVDAQRPGVATGAGATFTGPTNSAAPSTQKAKKTTVYQKAPASGRNGSLARFVGPDGQEYELRPIIPAAELPAAAEPGKTWPVVLEPVSPPAPAPAWVSEETETTFGQHQDAAGIVKVAIAASSWSGLRWFGILCVAGCIGGLLYSHNNPEGYPVICWKIGACGVVFIIFSEQPWLLLLLVIPAAFYLVQKLGLLRLPIP